MSTTTTDSVYANQFIDGRKIDLVHFYPVGWDCGKPTKFAFGYWSHGRYKQGLVNYCGDGFGSEE